MTRVRRSWPVVVFAAVALTACGGSWNPAITEIVSPAAATGSSGPQLTTFGDRTILSWIERSGETAALKFSERTPTGWTDPAQVASGDDWFVNWADVPSVVRIGTNDLAAHWLKSNGPDPEGYDLQLSFSHDNGRTWSAPTTPHHDGTPTEHGFASLYPAGTGGLGLVWIDGRAGDHMALRAATFSASGEQTSETVVRDRTCECCPTAIAVTGSGGVITAYRNLADEQIRDIYVARLSNGSWTAPAAVHNDGWRIDACPVNGPALAADGDRVAIAWFNAKTDQGHVYAAFSRDGGQTFGEPIRVDDQSALGRVDVALLGDGSAAVVWIEYAEGRSQLRLRRATASGNLSASTTVSSLASGRASGYPRVARNGGELLFAWTESKDGVTRVRTAAWRMPS